jgi:hypothetical protein
MRVTLDEPALRVASPGTAPMLFPLPRVSRVIASGPVEWSIEALLACAERGIPVTFLKRNGAISAFLFGQSTRVRSGLFYRLRDFLGRPDWQERYDDWHRAMESRARCSLTRQLGLCKPEDWRAKRLRATLAACKARHASPRVCEFVERRLRGLLAGLVAELLVEKGFTAERVRGLDERLDLPRDLVELLAWELQLPMLELLAAQPQEPTSAPRVEETALVALFEGRSPRLRQLGREMLSRLHGRLVELSP